MLCLRAVAGLAVDAGVLAGFLHFKDIGVAGFAGFVSGVNDGECGDFGNGVGSIVTVLTEAFGDEPGSEAEEEGYTHQEDRGDTDEVFRVFEAIHGTGNCTCRTMNEAVV